jgi:hypothetical protein
MQIHIILKIRVYSPKSGLFSLSIGEPMVLFNMVSMPRTKGERKISDITGDIAMRIFEIKNRFLTDILCFIAKPLINITFCYVR